MSQSEEEFKVGDRVAYLGFTAPEYGTITKVSIEITNKRGAEVPRYEIAMDTGGTFTALRADLRRL